MVEDLFAGKIAFVTLLNFPLTTLEERLAHGPKWSRREWAEARLANRFACRVPAEVNQQLASARVRADLYVSDYNVFMHHVLSEKGERLFPRGKRLLSHWNLRDELKAQYGQPGGLERQRAIARVMERIVTQTIPAAVVNNPTMDWSPWSNEVRPSPADTVEAGTPPVRASAAREADVRYEFILENFRAAKAADRYSPSAPTLMARKVGLEREIPEAKVVTMLEQVLGAPEVARVAKLLQARLGRPLEPFDIWYAGFRPSPGKNEEELDQITRARYPSAAAFAAALPGALEKMGFPPEKARWLVERIEVDPARGSGHALGAMRRGDDAHLRTRVGKDGMDYKGFNIAIHELGHTVEQTFSLYEVDHTLLQGVPNTAFTEAIAFVFRARALDVLGVASSDLEAKRLAALDAFWSTYEIAGVSLVDDRMWHWMYEHPRATPAELREATLGIARDVWNRWYAPVFGVRDVTLLAVYSHMVKDMLYLPDYPIGHLIAAQIEEYVENLPAGTSLGAVIERMTTYGAVAPDLWMEHAVGRPVSAEPLIRAAAKALEETVSRRRDDSEP